MYNVVLVIPPFAYKVNCFLTFNETKHVLISKSKYKIQIQFLKGGFRKERV